MKYFIIPLLLIVRISLAQTQLAPGYIIFKNQTDTIKGTIAKKKWRINPSVINFKSDIAGGKKFSINELSAFGIYNKAHFRVEKVDLDETPYFLNRIRKLPKTFLKKDTTIAMSVLINAEKSLYY